MPSCNEFHARTILPAYVCVCKSQAMDFILLPLGAELSHFVVILMVGIAVVVVRICTGCYEFMYFEL